MRNFILEIKDLSVWFRSSPGKAEGLVTAVDRLNLRVASGSFTSLVGESGSGKTVSALAICRLVRPHKLTGEILFDRRGRPRRDLVALGEKELLEVRGREIAYVFQDPASALNPVMKAGKQVDEVSGARDRTLALFSSVRLKDPERVYGSFPHELSGGMAQRVLIAMALAAEPRMLIADEPTTALDTRTEAEIMELLADVQRERSLTILFITHNMSLAAVWSDTIIVMQKGRVVEVLEKETAGFRPQELYTQRLFRANLENLKPKSFINV